MWTPHILIVSLFPIFPVTTAAEAGFTIATENRGNFKEKITT
jgi:hypothetical protein